MRFRIAPKQSVAVATLVLLGTLPAIAQQPYPSRPVRTIVPFPPGGSVDPLARLVAEKMSEGLNHRFIVDNRAGGNTIIGTDALAKSKPDGYTVMVMSRTFVISSLLYPAPYDIIKDFTPVGSLTRSEWLLLIHPSLPVNNLRELIALAKARPGQLNYATNFGSALHLAGEMLKTMAKIDMQIVNYKGGGPAFADLVGGHVELSLQPIVSSLSYIKSGRLRAVAVTGDKRLPALPQVATFTESGMPGFLSNSWFGMLAPAGTPRAIVGVLSAEIARVLALPDFRDKLGALGMEPFVSTPDQFAALIKADRTMFGDIIKSANIKVEP
jgi:tripartite-type tricarboxylate transporter receptor subunit TctC